MFKHVFVLFLFVLALQIEASVESDFKARSKWVRDLKTFIQNIEEKNPEYLMTKEQREVVFKFSLFSEAIASGNYDCFFGGWPSSLIQSGSKRFCQNPEKGNSEYQKGICKRGELQCQPLMFGKNVCVGFTSSSDKQKAFANCESKFKQNGNYDFLKSMTVEEKASLAEISLLAHDICVSGKMGIQKSKPMCKKMVTKFQEAMGSIARAPAAVEDEVEVVSAMKVREREQPIICEIPILLDNKIVDEANKTILTVNQPTDNLYQEIKKEFLASPMCEPSSVLNNPKEKLSPLVFNQLMEDMRFIIKTDSSLTREVKMATFKDVAQDYGLSADIMKYGQELLTKYQDTPAGRFEAMARLRGVMLQEMDKISKSTPGYQADLIKDELVKRKIFSEDEEGNSQCPFVSEEAFREALAGREAVMKSLHKSSITNPNLITIVDYSRPSNERRMFVIDISTHKVLHNTWVGHGGGKDRSQEAGIDKFGSSPMTSNALGSLLSSEGFYIAKKAGFGDTFLNNVSLQGIDVNNSTLASRAIVIHGWRTPNQEYVNKTWVMSESNHPKRLEGKDIYKDFMKIDFKTTSEDLFDLTQDLSSAAAARERVDATDGCLGVPDTQAGHLDRKNRQKSQLELLREDLPGSLMFNYTGPGKTKSKYLN
jgi:hypothetical protein